LYSAYSSGWAVKFNRVCSMRQEKILDKFWLYTDSGAYNEVNIREMNYV